MFRFALLVGLAWSLLAGALAQGMVTSPPPAYVVFVPHVYAYRLAKHPTLPVLYLGLGCAPDSRNLVTFGLDASGNVLTNTMRAFEDFFTDDGKNPTNFHSVLRPIVLPEQKGLLLAAQPVNESPYRSNSNAQHIAAIALDDQAQPTKLLKAFRTTHTEQSVMAMEYEPTTRRLFLSYWTYWGWCEIGKNGVPSPEFHRMPLPTYLWDLRSVAEGQRFVGVSQGVFYNFRPTADGTGVDVGHMITSGAGPFGGFAISDVLRKAYLFEVSNSPHISVYPLSKEGRLQSVPRRFQVGETALLRIDPKARRLYSFTQGGVMRIQPLDAEGYPTGTAEVFQVACGSIRDVLVDEPSGKVYVACTEPPK